MTAATPAFLITVCLLLLPQNDQVLSGGSNGKRSFLFRNLLPGAHMSSHDLGANPDSYEFAAPHPEKEQPTATGVYARIWKRALDVVLSVVLLPVLLPIMALIWYAIQRDGGDAFFAQPRVGRGGKVYRCLKFRTMVPEAESVLEEMCADDPEVAEEWNKYQKLSDDPRITKIGHILRKTSLDELPQIINVLHGEMSLVGPRPFLPSQRETYDRAGGQAYYDLRPGVTGLWQIFSRHDTTFATRVQFDENYAEGMSLLSDLGLILRTVRVVLRGTGC